MIRHELIFGLFIIFSWEIMFYKIIKSISLFMFAYV
jgi:hypothetical protein